ncbi:MAG: type II toxin-antitoxin system PemK/MazF family toxin [Bifidobacteriaceae bacterium]|jgi:mRNA interferase MazF|nr:type II toxin-antitoxin system PemK/MazF family toxin [Bifidobacteriaceae bacterium]
MRAIAIARIDKARPVLVLTRVPAIGRMTKVTVAPITSTVRGLSTEVPVGPRNGLDQACAVNCDNIRTIPRRALGRSIGLLFDDEEHRLALAIANAFDLDL